MVEADPWYNRVKGPFPAWDGPTGCKADGGGSHRARGKVGNMLIHRAVNNRNAEGIKQLVEQGENINEVEAAGNTPMHFAAYQGWIEGAQLLLSLGAKANPSNNAGDRPWHWAKFIGNEDFCDWILKNGGTDEQGQVLVPDHIPKVKDFFEKDCWKGHPKPYNEYMEWRKAEDAEIAKHANDYV